MDIFILAVLAASAAYILKTKDERRRISLLASHLGNHQIEKLMEDLMQGYMRALGEQDAQRREQIWHLLGGTEARLSEQFNSFAAEFASADALAARVSRLPVSLPYAREMLPGATFDLRQALNIHAQGISRAVQNEQNRTPKARAFVLMAELLLMQHSCHWFCKSKTVASARLLVRHQTSYEQVLAAVAPETRRAYEALVRE